MQGKEPLLSQSHTLGERLRGYRVHHGLSQEALAEAIETSTRSVRRWEQDLAIPHAISRERLCTLFGIEAQDLFASLSLNEGPQPLLSPSLWTVPYQRNSCFTGREAILQSVHTLLAAQQTPASAQSIALSGLGGIGKTQLAIEYAYRYGQEYSAEIGRASCRERV